MPADTDTELFLWGARAFAVIALLGVVAILAAVWWLIVRPVITEALRANEAGSWWLPFLPGPDGGYGPLADNHWWSAMRASAPGSGAALALRWGFWGFVAVALTAGMVRALVQLAQLGLKLWD
ncbi:hypothetical protein GCM10022415_02450 [Knoellia locipacati]|uniref:Uncharacterized protein n=1 Tax=Knoellia locipacati TaxID=882824 RepID=A0A512SW69_9MICO|nr:hypothetical protein [Knoellia locipacati]GEQ12198.1 hypothetical protein KLO01_02450 [Knoellia locipacati]